MKYVDTKIVFAEVPDEVTLAINISNCPCHCEGCHSPYLAEDIGKPLNWSSLNALIHINHGITCVAFMGGDASPKQVNELAWHVKQMGLKTYWYSGRQELSKEIALENFDFIKLGPYIPSKGGLDSPSTNQRFYRIEDQPWYDYTVKGKCMRDITYKFWH